MSQLSFTIKGRDAWLTCQCGKRECIASGYVALAFDDSLAIDCGEIIGWRMSPVVMCPECKEKNEANRLVEQAR